MSKISRRNAMAIILGGAGYLVCTSVSFAGKDQVLKRIDAITKKKGAQELFDAPIDGCVFIHPDKQKGLIKGPRPARIKFLDEIPSPYLNGMLDDFFDGRLSPFIETNRGCPFKCSFCHTGNDYFHKIRSMLYIHPLPILC